MRVGLPLLFVLMLAALAASTPTGTAGDDPHVPCADPRGCPDLTVEAQDLQERFVEERVFTEAHCDVVEGMVEPGLRRLMRFTFTTPNVGAGDLVIGAPADHPEWFEWSPCHAHHHFVEYADYRLWQPQAYAQWQAVRAAEPTRPSSEVLEDHPELQAGLVSGHKQGFCVIDYQPALGVRLTAGPQYRSCTGDQGISVGWADSYVASLSGQYLDITDVRPGVYMLEAEVNAERFYVEALYANNAAAVAVVVT